MNMIKVKDLIKKLQTFDQEAIVIMQSDNFEKGQDYVDTVDAYELKCNKETKTYRDAFDGETYTGVAYVLASEENKRTKERIKCVKLYA